MNRRKKNNPYSGDNRKKFKKQKSTRKKINKQDISSLEID